MNEFVLSFGYGGVGFTFGFWFALLIFMPKLNIWELRLKEQSAAIADLVETFKIYWKARGRNDAD